MALLLLVGMLWLLEPAAPSEAGRERENERAICGDAKALYAHFQSHGCDLASNGCGDPRCAGALVRPPSPSVSLTLG